MGFKSILKKIDEITCPKHEYLFIKRDEDVYEEIAGIKYHIKASKITFRCCKHCGKTLRYWK